MEESWEVCVAHMQTVVESIAGVVAQGVASGEFGAPDVPLTALCICQGMMGYFHPQMIAECVNKPGPTLDQMIDFILAGLVPHGKKTIGH